MTYVLNPSDELARRIEEKAAAEGTTPEEWLVRLAEGATQSKYAADESFTASQEKIFDKYSAAFEILAEGAK
jgi:hypothetical protein